MDGRDDESDSLLDLRLGISQLLARVEALEVENASLRAENAGLRDEVARLKKLPSKPKFPPSKPSGMAQAPDVRSKKAPKRRRGGVKSKLSISQTIDLRLKAPPKGARFKGYTDYVVQDLTFAAHVTRYRREKWCLADGRVVLAPLPDCVQGGFGAALRRFVIGLHVEGQVTAERLVCLLNGSGLRVSKRQILRILSDQSSGFVEETAQVLRAGLQDADWITVDDTGARHQGHSFYATQIGNDRFCVFDSGASKSRIRFLQTLQAGERLYLIDEHAAAYMRRHALPACDIAQLMAHQDRRFERDTDFAAHLEQVGLAQSKIATEGALWAGLKAQQRLEGTVIVSDGAGQFRLGEHALCWVHAERLIHKLEAITEAGREAVKRIKNRIWWLYRDLKAYARDPTHKERRALSNRFERIFTTKTGFVLLDRQLKRLHAQKAGLLKVLDRPDIPLHTNGSENDIRAYVTKRKISGATQSEHGRIARDAWLSLAKTCKKLNITFWDYLGDRLNVKNAKHIPPLADIILAR